MQTTGHLPSCYDIISLYQKDFIVLLSSVFYSKSNLFISGVIHVWLACTTNSSVLSSKRLPLAPVHSCCTPSSPTRQFPTVWKTSEII